MVQGMGGCGELMDILIPWKAEHTPGISGSQGEWVCESFGPPRLRSGQALRGLNQICGLYRSAGSVCHPEARTAKKSGHKWNGPGNQPGLFKVVPNAVCQTPLC